ncbi:MAG: DNA cytosine methyltransferase, partial [Peptostreptococcaceae bacterium]
TVGQALEKVDSTWFNYSDITTPKQSTLDKIKHIPQGGNFKNIPEELRGKGVHSNSYRRLEMNKPSCTLTNFRKSQILNPIKDRIISVAEALAISGFDDKFKVLGALNSRQQQVGNGVPFNLGYAIKETIKRMFFNYELALYDI